MRIAIKLGGSILEESGTRQAVLRQVAGLVEAGHEVILVHGGGKRLSRRLAQLGIESKFIGGLRVTDAETLEVALMVLSGEVNKMLVAELARLNCKALGICGADGASVRCRRMADYPDSPQGLEFVGRPIGLDRAFFEQILSWGLTPVVSSIAMGPDCRLYNVNADQMAAICASGAGCKTLVFLTDVPGVRDENGTVLREIGRKDIDELRSKGVVTGGRLP